MASIRLDVEPLALPLKHAFTIARSSETVAQTVLVRLHWNGIEALGESAPSERYSENVASVAAGLAALDLGDDPYALDRLLSGLPPAESCGLDIALHDCIGKDLDRPLWRLFGLDPSRTPVTSFTIGIAPLDETLVKVREVGSHPVIKVKLGKGAELETIDAIRSIYTGTIRVDANEGWTPEQAVTLLGAPKKRSRCCTTWRTTTSSSANSRFRLAIPNSCAGSAPSRQSRSSPTKMPKMRATCRHYWAASTGST